MTAQLASQFSSLTDRPNNPPYSVEIRTIRQMAQTVVSRYPRIDALAVERPLATDIRRFETFLPDQVEMTYGDAVFHSPTLQQMVRKACRDVVIAHLALVRVTHQRRT